MTDSARPSEGTESQVSAALIEVEPSAVRAAGITPGRCMVWALEKHKDGKHEQALRLLDAAAALIREEAGR